MPRGRKRAASTSSKTSTNAAVPKTKRSRTVIKLVVPTAPTRPGAVLTCGQGDVGQLGLGEDVPESTRFRYVKALGDNIVDACAGGMHTMAMDKEGTVWTFGCNDEGALGRPTADEAEEGAPGRVALPRPAVAISAGDSHSAALLDDGRVYAWGSFRDSHGSMGLVFSGREGKACKEPVRIDVGEQAAAIASGTDHLVILTTSNGVFTVGCGEQGQLGRLSQRSASREARQGFAALLIPGKANLKPGASRIWAGYHATFALDASGERMYAWGLNNYGQLGVTGEKHKLPLYSPVACDAFAVSSGWREVACGQHHSLALDGTGRVYAVGRRDYGRLGLGDREEDASTLEPVPELGPCRSIAAGTCGSSAVTETGEAYSWGMGSEGALGTGGTADASLPARCVLEQRAHAKVHVLRASAGGQHTVIHAEVININGESAT